MNSIQTTFSGFLRDFCSYREQNRTGCQSEAENSSSSSSSSSSSTCRPVVVKNRAVRVGVGRTFETVCLFLCLFVCLFVCPQHNSKTNDPEVFKLGEGNDLGMF